MSDRCVDGFCTSFSWLEADDSSREVYHICSLACPSIHIETDPPITISPSERISTTGQDDPSTVASDSKDQPVIQRGGRWVEDSLRHEPLPPIRPHLLAVIGELDVALRTQVFTRNRPREASITR